jgi:sigma-B regulation protein RsbU (phosphoserine phosphatase)
MVLMPAIGDAAGELDRPEAPARQLAAQVRASKVRFTLFGMQTQPTRPPPGTEPGARATVLLVDDGPENRMLIRAILERAGYIVLVADSGAAGLRILEQQQADLIVLDYMMPEMDGAEVARRVRATEALQDIPIIMLTASQEEPHIEEAFAAGVNDYITKPVDRRILAARVETMIRAATDSRRAKAAVASDREWGAIMTDLNEAARVQQGKLPPMPARVQRWGLAGALVPSRHIGGDLYDLMPGPDGGHVVAVVDVSGHGMAAALVAASLLNQLRTLVRNHPLPTAMRALNAHLSEESGEKYACVAVIELRGDQAAVINAGLPPICLVRGGACLTQLHGAGVPPGLLPDTDYEQQVARLLPGDRLVIMSDGLTEPFGAADQVSPCLHRMGLLEAGLQIETLTTAVLTERIRTLLRSAGDGELDDATLLLAELG